MCFFQGVEFDNLQRQISFFRCFFQRSVNVIFRERAAIGIINHQSIFIQAFATFCAFFELWIVRFLINLFYKQTKCLRQFFTSLKSLFQKPFRVTHKVKLICSYNRYKFVFPLCFCILKSKSQQFFAISLTFILS